MIRGFAPVALEHPRFVLQHQKLLSLTKPGYDWYVFKPDNDALAHRPLCVLCRTVREYIRPGTRREPITFSIAITRQAEASGYDVRVARGSRLTMNL